MKLVLDLSYGAANFVMPNLLSKVRADVLSINPYAQTPGMIAVDRAASEARVADAVRGRARTSAQSSTPAASG